MNLFLATGVLAWFTLFGCSSNTGGATTTDAGREGGAGSAMTGAGGTGTTTGGSAGAGATNGGAGSPEGGQSNAGGAAAASTGGGDTGSGGAAGSGGAGNGPCYHLGDSGLHPCANDAACSAPQYTVNGNGTVSTTCCGLTWQQADEGMDSELSDAAAYCSKLSLAGGGWRVPTSGEIESMVDHCETTPTVDRTAFPNARADTYWSSTVTDAQGDVWVVSLIYDGSGTTGGISSPNLSYAVRCVR